MEAQIHFPTEQNFLGSTGNAKKITGHYFVSRDCCSLGLAIVLADLMSGDQTGSNIGKTVSSFDSTCGLTQPGDKTEALLFCMHTS